MLEYSSYNLPEWELEELAKSMGVSILHASLYKNLNSLIERLQKYGSVVFIDGNGKSAKQIKELIEGQYGRKEIVLFDSVKRLPDMYFLEYAAQHIEASLIVVNRRKFKTK